MMKFIIFLFLLCVAPTIFSQSIKVEKKIKLSKKVEETSGIVLMDNDLLTFNDSGGKPELYVIKPKSGKIKKIIKVTNATNVDWESITQDDEFVYIGDTGNNYGNRKNLVIYKIKKSALKSKEKIKSEKIYFSYQDQKKFKEESHQSNFDCEAITVYKNQLLIFTKNWIDNKTNIYTIPINKGTYVAKKVQSIDINCLITSVDYNKETNTLIGTAYDKDYKSYLILIKDFNLTSNKFTKMELTPILGYANQIEAIAWKNNKEFYITREASIKELNKKKYSYKQKLLRISLID